MTGWLLRYIVRSAARRQGFLDPIELLARLRSFAQPSEVGEPIELLRAGVVFHARGLINSRVIQYNLDWVWPYWIERQYDPHDISFIPRAFSVSHINLTHRNWTAIGYPDCEEFPLVDPCGLLTPHLDGWSIEGWIITERGKFLLPSRLPMCSQLQSSVDGHEITTRCKQGELELISIAKVTLENGIPVCQLTLTARSDSAAWLVLALRPQNTEGISFVSKVTLSEDRLLWTVEDAQTIAFSAPAERHYVSDYRNGDVLFQLTNPDTPKALQSSGSCAHGMVTAAAMFAVSADKETTVTARIPLVHTGPALVANAWKSLRETTCKLQCPEPLFQCLYDAAVTSLILLSPGDVYPGPSTYKRFWFRDAAFIIHAMLCAGLEERALRAFTRFPERQTNHGYFRSQDGEWDSNGEVLWILNRYEQISGKKLGNDWQGSITRGARWIMRKRLGSNINLPHAGLLPAGFSAEHLGPNDYYYWDDFWGVAGLQSASELVTDPTQAAEFTEAAKQFREDVDKSLRFSAARLGQPGMPASPYRRLDSGAIGSIVAGYPLQLFDADDPRLLDCADFLLENCFVDDAFFQDMIHSGLNAYLTLHVAQVLLRREDPRYLKLMDAVAALASSTGQWPEAIHPRTKGGCMGDGHHVWASAEWLLMIRNCFLREEGESLILCAGIPERWLLHSVQQGTPISFGPAPTSFGPVSITINPHATSGVEVSLQTEWHHLHPAMELRMPGFAPVLVARNAATVTLERRKS